LERELTACSRCGKVSKVELRYNGLSLCGRCFVAFFERRVRRTIGENHMIHPGDKVAVALSGGKDSVVLLHLLHKFNEMHDRSVKLLALTIDQGLNGEEQNLKNAKEVSEARGVEHFIFSFKEEFGHTVDELAALKPGLCNCGVFRRNLLNRKARALGADKLATGHNLDDEAESALMNFMSGNLVRMARGDGIVVNTKFVRRIKPLRRSPEEEVALYAGFVFPSMRFSPECPYRGEVIRRNIKRVVDELEGRHPGIRYQILQSSEKLSAALTRDLALKNDVKDCAVCGEPTSGEVCNACTLLREVRQLCHQSP